MALGGLKTETVETHCHVDEQFVDIERTWLPPSEAMTINAIPNWLG
jgi:hypothetical protein